MKVYMDVETGNTGEYDDWTYVNEDGDVVNAVDLGEVVEVEKNFFGEWIEV